MSYEFLSLLFRLSGHSPSGARKDHFLGILAVCLILGSSSILWSWYHLQDLESDELPLLGTKLCLLVCNLGSLAKANLGAVTFNSLASEVATSVDVWTVLSIFTLYLCGMGMRLLSYTVGMESLMQSLRRFTTFHFSIVPFCQEIILARALKKACSSTNMQLSDIFNRSGSNTSKGHLETILHEYTHLKSVARRIDEYFSFYNALFIFSNLMYAINLFMIFLRAIESHSEAMYRVFGVSFMLMMPTTFLWLYYNGDCANEINKTVQVVHENVNVDTPVEIMDMVEKFSLAHVNNPVAFTAGGFFPLGMGLLTKMVGLSLTYFVIVLQLDSLDI